MPYTNIHRGARISPKKAKLVTDLIKGRPVDEALTILSMSPKRGSVMVKSALNAAIANADAGEADTRRLFVKVAKVDGGPTIKRFRPKDRGRAHPIMKRTSHITVTVDEKTEA